MNLETLYGKHLYLSLLCRCAGINISIYHHCVAVQVFQQLDEHRITFLRQELWRAINADSQIALDIDNVSAIFDIIAHLNYLKISRFPVTVLYKTFQGHCSSCSCHIYKQQNPSLFSFLYFGLWFLWSGK